MELTELCKQEFKNWYLSGFDIDEDEFFNNETLIELFYEQPNNEKYGVLVDYFDSVRIYICTELFSIEEDIAIEFIGKVEDKRFMWNTVCKTRQEARVKAIEKANELRNQQLNK